MCLFCSVTDFCQTEDCFLLAPPTDYKLSLLVSLRDGPNDCRTFVSPQSWSRQEGKIQISFERQVTYPPASKMRLVFVTHHFYIVGHSIPQSNCMLHTDGSSSQPFQNSAAGKKENPAPVHSEGQNNLRNSLKVTAA